jgi:pilin isopeptide linkage protein
MVAVSGITTNTSMRAADTLGVQEANATDDAGATIAEEGGAAAEKESAAAETPPVSGENTSETKEIQLNDGGASENPASETKAENADGEKKEDPSDTKAADDTNASKNTEADSESANAGEDSSSVSSSSASSSSSSEDESDDEVPSEEEQIQKAIADAAAGDTYNYPYEDANISVNAVLTDPKAIPDDAKLRVTPITKNTDGYNYQAYMDALNAEATASSGSGADAQKYTADNTLLYDIAFIYSVKVKAEDGTVTNKDVEVQPAEGSVQIKVHFSQNQLSNMAVGEETKEVSVIHLPLTSNARESYVTTKAVTDITSNDVTVKAVDNAEVSTEENTASFKISDFSVFAFTTNTSSTEDEPYTWEGSENIAYSSFMSQLGVAGQVAVYAENFTMNQHVEGTVAVDQLTLNTSQSLMNGVRVQPNNMVSSVTVTKSVNEPVKKDTTFNFAFFDKDKNRIGSAYSVKIPAEQKQAAERISVTENSDIYNALLNGHKDLYIYELDDEGKPIEANSKSGDYTVTYPEGQLIQAPTSTLSNYIGTLDNQSNTNVFNATFFGPAGVTTYLRDDGPDKNYNEDGLSLNILNQSGSTVFALQNYKQDILGGNKESNNPSDTYLKQVSADQFESLTQLNSNLGSNGAFLTLSSNLANAKNGKHGNGDFNVINVKSTPNSGVGSFTTDLQNVGYGDPQNDNDDRDALIENDSNYLLINIDCTGCSTYSMGKMVILGRDGERFDPLGSHIVFNFVQRSESGSGYVPFTGTVNLGPNIVNGIVFAPAATVNQGATLNGSMIAKSVIQTPEIHQVTGSQGEKRNLNLTISNSTVAPVEASITAKKSLNGRGLKAGEFSFTLTAENNAPMPKDAQNGSYYTVSNAADGTIDFGKITYYEPGTYSYKIREVNGTESGVTYDQSEKNVTVTVKKDNNGKLTAQVQGDGDSAAFTNEYTAKGTAQIEVTKAISGRNWTDADRFTFMLKPLTTDAPMPDPDTATATQADKVASFGLITYSKPGTYEYSLTEVKGNEPGITYDSTTHTVSVAVTEGDDGTLATKVTYDGQENLTITNHCSTSITFRGTKRLDGQSMTDGEFSFSVKEDGNTVSTGRNDAKGNITFDPIYYAEAGEHTYTVSEDIPAGAVQKKDDDDQNYYEYNGIRYSNETYTVNVKVSTESDGTLKAVTDAAAESLKFTNKLEDASASVRFEGTKEITGWPAGRNLPRFQFNVVRRDSDGKEVYSATAWSDEKGHIGFPVLNYTLADAGKTYYYDVSEENAGHTIDGVTYDDHSYRVTVKVNRNSDGTLSADASGDAEKLNFTNNYEAREASAVIRGSKKINGGAVKVKAGQFRFNLLENNQVIDTATNDAEGNFVFGKILYTSAGSYTYTIEEQNAGKIIDGIRYQSEARTVTINVRDEGNGQLVADDASAVSFDNTQYGSITVRKNWNDAGNESYRPSSVVFDLIDAETGTTVQKAELSDANNWTATFDQIVTGKRYTVHEEENSAYYEAENNDQVVTADVNGSLVTIVNDYIYPSVTIYANKVLNGGTLTSGEFTFNLYRNSDPDTVVKTATNNASGEIFFTDITYDAKGYTVREVAGDDASITYDSDAITYDADGNITSTGHTVFTNTQRPIVLRVQKRSKEAPYDPLEGATYGLYQVVEGGNDILVESEISDENGYMYYGRIQPGVIYYFKEIAAPEGHEVDPYPGQKFQVKYTGNGQIALYDENGNPTTVGDITGQDSNNLLVQYTTEKTAVDTSSSLSYSDDSIVAVAKADNSNAFAAGTTLKVTQLSGSDAKAAAAAVEAACGKISSNIAYYDIQFIDASGKEVEPAGGDVTVTIQYKDSLDLPEGTDRTALKLVHLTKAANGETTVEAVPGTVAADQNGLLQTSFTADSFSTFGVVEPGSDNTLGQNYLVTAAGVADQVSELKVAKLDTSGKYVKGAVLQIIEKSTGTVRAEWTTTDGPKAFARWFDDAQTVPMNVDTDYILHEVSAPEGYELADDIQFRINKYDSSITVYKNDGNGNLVVDQEAIDKWVSDTTLQMIDVPVKHETVTLVKQKLVPNEKTIQGENKVVNVTSVQAVRTGDTTPIALFVILLVAAAAVLLIMVYRGRRKKDN